jgi:hypothetical protein
MMKKLQIEWKHIETRVNTCIRCADTGEALDYVVERLANECRPHGWEIIFKETILDIENISESNIILLNGHPIESILPGAISSENHCESCCDFTGDQFTCCRILEVDGISYEGIPASIIRRAVCEIADCC